MIVNAAVFTCSICGEASVNICSYCTKDACSNHRCERCKRCSDCCECEFPLSAEEPIVPEAIAETVIPSELEPQMDAPPDAEPVIPNLDIPNLRDPNLHDPSLHGPSLDVPSLHSPGLHSFLTAEESSVFAEESAPREPRIFGESSVFAEEDPAPEDTAEEELAEEEPGEEDGSAGPVA